MHVLVHLSLCSLLRCVSGQTHPDSLTDLKHDRFGEGSSRLSRRQLPHETACAFSQWWGGRICVAKTSERLWLDICYIYTRLIYDAGDHDFPLQPGGRPSRHEEPSHAWLSHGWCPRGTMCAEYNDHEQDMHIACVPRPEDEMDIDRDTSPGISAGRGAIFYIDVQGDQILVAKFDVDGTLIDVTFTSPSKIRQASIGVALLSKHHTPILRVELTMTARDGKQLVQPTTALHASVTGAPTAVCGTKDCSDQQCVKGTSQDALALQQCHPTHAVDLAAGDKIHITGVAAAGVVAATLQLVVLSTARGKGG